MGTQRLPAWSSPTAPYKVSAWGRSHVMGAHAAKAPIPSPADESQLAAKRIKRLMDRMRHSLQLLNDSIEIDADKRGGVPVLKGTRFKVSQLLAEMLYGDQSISGVAEDLDLDVDTIRKFVEGWSIAFDLPQHERATPR